MRKARRRTQTAPRPRVTARINDQIHARQVRLVDEAGEQVGVMPVEAAREHAESRELDLVEVAPEADPPVCRVLEYSKWRASEELSRRASLRNQTNVSSKEIRVRPRISDHDYRWKRDRAAQFLQDRSKVPGRRVLSRAGAGACRRGATTARAVRGRRGGVRPRRSRRRLRRSKPHDVARAERSAVVIEGATFMRSPSSSSRDSTLPSRSSAAACSALG